MTRFYKFFALFLSSILFLLSLENLEALCYESPIIYVGPEIYHLERNKSGGSEQDGWLYGGRALYERRKPAGFYWAIDGLYANGTITGKSASGRALKSKLTEAEVEGRLGYSLNFRMCSKFSFIPYVGYGRYYAKNDFKHPSPLCCTFHDRCEFGLVGLMTTYKWNDQLEASIDFQAKYILDGRESVSKDPKNDNITLKMHEEWQYELTVPIIYTTCWRKRVLKINAAPFFRYRHFGGMLNYPYDFIDTKFYCYGAHILLYLSY